jgi:hypothetical protein
VLAEVHSFPGGRVAFARQGKVLRLQIARNRFTSTTFEAVDKSLRSSFVQI